MMDGIRLAISSWLTADDITHNKSYPVVLVTTRYWRAMALSPDNIDDQAYTGWAKVLIDNGYRLVVADARGTGASFGTRDAEVDNNEVSDIAELIDWVAHQPWCDGRVATHGTSYSGITTLYSLATAPEALKIGICRAPDFDMYRHLIAPGGIVNRWFIEGWGAHTAAQDANDVKAMFSTGYMPIPSGGADNILGVRPVDGGNKTLTKAVAEHRNNFNIANVIDELDYIDNFLTERNPPIFDPVYKDTIDNSGVPLIIRCGWHDAATALGALSMYASFKHLPLQVILGPFNHEGTYIVDPFDGGDGTNPRSIPLDEGRAWRIDYLNAVFDPVTTKDKGLARCVHYYTLGENRWHKTQQWPLPKTQMQRLYFAEGHGLTARPPVTDNGQDIYQVDTNATTGLFNRWYAQSQNQPVYFEDRQQEDKKLLVYDSEPLTQKIEITGHPVVSLFLQASVNDGQYFVYLESIDADGRIRLLTEGQLRGVHHKVSAAQPLYRMFGPYHSLSKSDAEYLPTDKVAEISFDLLPISIVLKTGTRLRVAIAGADADTFAPLPNAHGSTIAVQRNDQYASFIDIPVIE
jgi:putative CocE/NonD family hydrolase